MIKILFKNGSTIDIGGSIGDKIGKECKKVGMRGVISYYSYDGELQFSLDLDTVAMIVDTNWVKK